MIFKPDITESQMKLLLLIALVSLGVMVRLLMPGFYTHVWQFAYTGDIEGTVSYLRSFGMRAAVLSAGITVFVTMTGILPSIFISAANGIVFGLVGGDPPFVGIRNDRGHYKFLADADFFAAASADSYSQKSHVN